MYGWVVVWDFWTEAKLHGSVSRGDREARRGTGTGRQEQGRPALDTSRETYFSQVLSVIRTLILSLTNKDTSLHIRDLGVAPK